MRVSKSELLLSVCSFIRLRAIHLWSTTNLVNHNDNCLPDRLLSRYVSNIRSAHFWTSISSLDIIWTTLCVRLGGLWTAWGSFSACTDSCGSCGQQTATRTCVSSSYGCPCRSELFTYICHLPIEPLVSAWCTASLLTVSGDITCCCGIPRGAQIRKDTSFNGMLG